MKTLTKLLMALTILIILGTGLYQALLVCPEYKPTLVIIATIFVVLAWGDHELGIFK